MTLVVRRILARNPGPFTGPGTNTYLVGDESGFLVLDPGPVDAVHADAIVSGAGSTPIESVVVTHTHSDHAPLANPLAADLGVPAIGYAPGPSFDPDLVVGEGDHLDVGESRLSVIHTPGHSDDHVCLLAGTTLFTGDHIMGGSSVMVDDLAPYLRSLERLQRLELDRIHPGHGPDVDEPQRVISWYLAHRLERERQILEVLADGRLTVGDIVERLYVDVDASLYPLAARSVGAHVRKLSDDGVAVVVGDGWVAEVSLVG